MRFPIRRLLVVGGGAVILATAGFAYMASNTVQPSNAGEGSAAVSGYTVYNIDYSGLSGPNAGGTLPLTGYIAQGNTGSLTYIGAPTVNGLAEQDGVTTVSFQLSPDNARWAAVQLYDGTGKVIGGGGASNCGETSGVWTCNVRSTEGYTGVPVSEIAYIDVEAAE